MPIESTSEPFEFIPYRQDLMKPAKWKILSSHTVFERLPWVRVLSEDVGLPDGRVVKGYIRLESRDFVMVVPVNHTREIGMIQSYKHGPRDIDLQPPAGYIENHEQPLEAAKRELLEETGYASRDWQSLGAYTISGNQGAGTAHFFLATECNPIAEPNPGDLETQEILWIPIQDVKAKWQSGKFQQLSSMAILGLALSYLQ